MPSTKLTNLPTEVLQQIISGTNLWSQNCIRGTCKRLRDVTDDVTWHEVKVALHDYNQDPIKYQHYNSLRVSIIKKKNSHTFLIFLFFRCYTLSQNSIWKPDFLVYFWNLLSCWWGSTAMIPLIITYPFSSMKSISILRIIIVRSQEYSI
jgi:hypothetical protein